MKIWLTDDSEVNSREASWGPTEVNSTPVEAAIGLLDALQDQFGVLAIEFERRSAVQRFPIPVLSFSSPLFPEVDAASTITKQKTRYFFILGPN